MSPEPSKSTAVSQVFINPEAQDFALRIAETGSFMAQREVARLYSCLRTLESRMRQSADFWNVEGSASGILTSSATTQDGTPVWRLCPTNTHCIALIAKVNGDLCVLEICSRADIGTIERKLRKLDSSECAITNQVIEAHAETSDSDERAE